MKFSRSILAALLLILSSCSLNQITLPPINPESNLAGTVPVPFATMKKMEGIYSSSDGNKGLGSQFVCKLSRYKISFFSNQNGILIILKYGLNKADNSIQFAGFWRVSENSTQGLINFSISNSNGASDLIQSGIVTNLKLQGIFKNGDGPQDITLQYARPFTQYAQTHEFIVFGHHGIQTTANPPYAENSINAVLNAESYGLSGIEYDVRLTKDNVPICVHDPSINIRLTMKSPLAGSYDTYGFTLLREFVDLIDGQKIPSVEEVLNAFIDETYLKYAWLDIKGNPDVFKYMEPVVRNAYARAKAQNRDVVIFVGLPSKDVITEFKKQPSYSAAPNALPTLSELSMSDVIDNKSSFFGPRYSEGLLLSDVELAHSMGVKVISWTLNDKNIIKNYLQNGKFDGFITDYAAFAVYGYYTMY